ncbi:unnamed protein product [Dicrocoelium dendriticum]|nr:unnamed protein product [Dicrocoelium dendriticum]
MTLTEYANFGVRYGNAYASLLLRDVSTGSAMPSRAEQKKVGAVGLDLRTASKDSVDDSLGRADQQWPIGRVATLRLVSVRRAAAALQKSLNPRYPSNSERFYLLNLHCPSVLPYRFHEGGSLR